MANELDVFLAIVSFVALVLAALLIVLVMSYKEYKKENRIDVVSIGSIIIAIIVTSILTITIIWDILMNTLNSIEASDVMGAGRAVSGFFIANFIILGFTFALSHGILGNIHQKLSKENDDAN